MMTFESLLLSGPSCGMILDLLSQYASDPLLTYNYRPMQDGIRMLQSQSCNLKESSSRALSGYMVDE